MTEVCVIIFDDISSAICCISLRGPGVELREAGAWKRHSMENADHQLGASLCHPSQNMTSFSSQPTQST